MNNWLDDNFFKRFLKNSGILLSGDAIYTLLSIVSLILTARALGPEVFGILVTIQTYILVVDRLINFQSWPAIIKYGTDSLQQQKHDNFKSLIKFGFILDLLTAALGTALAMLGTIFFQQWFGFHDSVYIKVSIFYCLVILVNLTGVPTAVLRLFNKFKQFTIHKTIISAFRLMSIIIAFLLNAQPITYFIIWLIFDLLSHLLLIGLGFYELKKQSYEDFFKSSLHNINQKYKGIISFFVSTNVSSTIRMLSRELDIILITAFLGTKASGLFKMAKQFANIPLKLFDPFFYAIYPELTKLWASRNIEAFKQMIFRTAVSGSIMTLFYFIGFAVIGKWIIHLTVGAAFLNIYETALIYIIAVVIAVAILPLSPAVFSIGKHSSYLVSLIIATLGYFAALPTLLSKFEINGASLAYILFYAIYSAFILYFFKNILKHQETLSETQDPIYEM